MSEHKTTVGFSANAHIETKMDAGLPIRVRRLYRVECWKPDGTLRWVEEVENTNTTEGLNDLLTQYFKGSAYTAAFFVGLVDLANFSAFNATDTAAKITTSAPSGGTNQWREVAAFISNATRPALTLGAVSAAAVNNSASKAVFNINGGGTLHGAFVVTNSTIGGTSGKLFGAAAFAADRAVLNGDTINVEIDLSAS